MKIEITKSKKIPDWQEQIIVIDKGEYLRADLGEIRTVIEMYCSLFGIETSLSVNEHKYIRHLLRDEEGMAVFFGMSFPSGRRNSFPHFIAGVEMPFKKIEMVLMYDPDYDETVFCRRP